MATPQLKFVLVVRMVDSYLMFERLRKVSAAVIMTNE